MTLIITTTANAKIINYKGSKLMIHKLGNKSYVFMNSPKVQIENKGNELNPTTEEVNCDKVESAVERIERYTEDCLEDDNGQQNMQEKHTSKSSLCHVNEWIAR